MSKKGYCYNIDKVTVENPISKSSRLNTNTRGH